MPAHERLEAVGADLDLAGADGLDLGAPGAAAAAAHDALDACDHLLGVAGLGDPVVGSEAQPAHALGHGGGAGADDDAELGEGAAEALKPRPGLGAEDGEIDDERAESHGGDRVGGHGTTEHAMLPTEAVEPL